MARASTPTLLHLDEWARLLGLTPAHFNGVAGSVVFPVTDMCDKIWRQHPWQSNATISREEVATAIREAEDEIASVLNFHPAPRYVEGEEVHYPRYHDRRVPFNSVTPSGFPKSVVTRYGNISAVGRRSVALAASEVAIVWQDIDGDGFDETAFIQVDISGSDAADIIANPLYTGSAVCDLKPYFVANPSTGLANDGDRDWEIRDISSKRYDSGTEILTIMIKRWNLVSPVLWEAYPATSNFQEDYISLDDVSNFVSTVDIYLEYTDWSQPASEFYWRDESCSDGLPCPGIMQTGCLYIQNSKAGIVTPYPASYADGAWSSATALSGMNPDRVKVWYVSGYRRDTRSACNDIEQKYKMAIFYLSVGRLVKDVCSCDNVHDYAGELREPLTVGSQAGNFIVPIQDVLTSPFGVRKGEVMAWRQIKQIYSESRIIGAIV